MELAIEADKIKDIQTKLSEKILPILEKHLTDTKEKKIVRSFVAECYVKTIRKLPHAKFLGHLKRLVNLVVSNGLRSRELAHREKARKALLKIMQDLTPSYLFLVCDVMKSLLIKGFQMHVYLFTMHNLM